jgi:superfamily II DNA or RNA helicase
MSMITHSASSMLAPMLVVHALWLPGPPATQAGAARLVLWAEDSELPGQPPPPRRKPGPHPYTPPPEELAAALGPFGGKSAAGSRVLRLPTAAGEPVASPELVREDLAAARTITAADWLVPTLEYDVDEALVALGELTGAGVVLGATARHLLEVAAFARDLVTRGRLLPTVDPAGPLALWRPVLTGPDAAWAQALCLGLPPAGWAHLDDQDHGPATVVAAAIDALVDAGARAALAGVRLPLRRRSGIAGAWLRALTGGQRRFAAPKRSGDAGSEAIEELAAALATWQRDAVGGPVRACFRLVEPRDDDQDGWGLQFALQAADEPSLVVDAERVWQAPGTLATIASPQETLLAELGRASRLYPELEPALRTAKPAGLEFGTEGAHHFLTAGAPLLGAAGFGVLLPSWWSRPSARLGVRLTASTPAQPGMVAGRAGIGQDGLVDFEWELALGDQRLTADELAELTALKTPLVRVRGQWVQVDPKRLAAGLRLLRDDGAGRISVADLLRLGAGDQPGPGGLPVTGVAATGWLGDLLTGEADQRLAPASEPDGFAGTLRPYQRRGLSWLEFLQRAGLGGILADDMGLGKTIQLLALLATDPPDAAPTLLVCPMSLVGNWQREAARFAPSVPVHVHHGAERARGEEFTTAVAQARLVVTTYALVARDAEALRGIDWHRIVVDEAQAIKNAATRQAAAVRAVPARHRVAVTGTPVENRLADLWSIMEFANPGLLGPAATFKKRYAEPVERHGDEEAAQRLRQLTQPFILRRLKTDRSIISDLPEKLEMEVVCNLTGEQASLYQAVVDDMLAKIEASDGIERRGLVLATMTKLKQVCNHPAQLLRDGTRLAGRSGKLARLEEILEEVLAAGEKALLFTQYAEFGGMLRAHLSARFGREVAFLHGGVRKADRDALVARFQAGGPDTPPLFVLSLKAGGTGLTLTAANHVIHVDRWWNPAVEDQATDRAFRIGQRRAVQVRKLVCAGTLEEKIAAMIRDKRGLAARIVGTGEQWLTELSTSELRSLLRLEQGAVVE